MPKRKRSDDDNNKNDNSNNNNNITKGGRQLNYSPNMPVPVLYKSRDVLVIDKPFDVHIDGGLPITIEKLINKQHPDMLKWDEDDPSTRPLSHERRKLKFCHQLDYSTSGVLCLAFTRDSCARVSTCFQFRTSQKWYLAVVLGHLQTETADDEKQKKKNKQQQQQQKSIQIRTFIGTDNTDMRGFRMCSIDENDKEKIQQCNAKLSETTCTVLKQGYYLQKQKRQQKDTSNNINKETSDTDEDTIKEIPVTKVLLKPTSGRRHQLRLHMKHIGHPICGDATYANDFVSHRMMLHAWKLSLPIDLDDANYQRPTKFKKNENGNKKDTNNNNDSTNIMNFEAPDPFEGDLFKWK